MKSKFFISVLLVIVFCVLATGSSENEEDSSLHVGDRVVIEDASFAAISEDAFDQLTDFCVAKDQIGVMNMMEYGAVRSVSPGTTGKLIKSHFTYREVRLDDDMRVWCIATEFVKAK